MTQPAALRTSFELITSLLAEGQTQYVSIDNFSGFIDLLDDYASAATDVPLQGRHHTGETPQDPSVQRGRRSVEIIFEMRRFITQFQDCDTEQGKQSTRLAK